MQTPPTNPWLLVVIAATAGCAAAPDSDAALLPHDAGADGGLDATIDGGLTADSFPAPRTHVCRFVPDATPRVWGIGETTNPCYMTGCPSLYRDYDNGGRSFGGCVWYSDMLDAAVCDQNACIPTSDFALFPDGGVDLDDFCCGNGPSCACDEICWSPDGIEPPHCVPRPDAGP